MTNREFREVLEDRTARYAVDVFKFLRSLPCDVSVKIISYQFGKSASSIGANYHEANRAESKDDFVHKISIALKEANGNRGKSAASEVFGCIPYGRGAYRESDSFCPHTSKMANCTTKG